MIDAEDERLHGIDRPEIERDDLGRPPRPGRAGPGEAGGEPGQGGEGEEKGRAAEGELRDVGGEDREEEPEREDERHPVDVEERRQEEHDGPERQRPPCRPQEAGKLAPHAPEMRRDVHDGQGEEQAEEPGPEAVHLELEVVDPVDLERRIPGEQQEREGERGGQVAQHWPEDSVERDGFDAVHGGSSRPTVGPCGVIVGSENLPYVLRSLRCSFVSFLRNGRFSNPH